MSSGGDSAKFVGVLATGVLKTEVTKNPARRRARTRVSASKVAVAGIVLLLGASVVVVPGALNRFVFGKLAVAVVGAGVAASCRAAGGLRRDARITLGLGVAVLFAATLASRQPIAAVLGRAPRYEGVFVLGAYIAAAWAGARLLGSERDPGRAVVALRTLIVVAVLVAFVAILEAAGLRPLSTDVSRPGSLLGNASDEGAVGTLCFGPLALIAVRNRDWLFGAGAAAAVAVTVLSASRGALAAMLVEIALVGMVVGGRRAAVVVLAAALALAAFAFALPATRHRVLGTSPLAGHTVTGRDLLWRESFALDASHLALGVGPSNYKTAIVAKHDREWQTKVGPQDPPDSPHSLPLQALSAGGAPLLLVLIALCGQVIVVGGRAAWRGRTSQVPLEAGCVVALVGYGIASLVGLTSPGPTLLASVFLGVALSGPAVVRRRSITATLAGASLLLLGVWFLLAAIAEIPLRHAVLDVARGNDQAADRAFAAARDLRLWDIDLPDVAAHAFVTQGLADGDAAAINAAGEWLGRIPHELRNDEQVELDTASVDEAQGQYGAAESVLTRVLTDDHDDPAVLLQRGVVEAEAHSTAAAERDFRSAASVVPDDPGPWSDLAALYTEEHRTDAAAAARARAARLSATP